MKDEVLKVRLDAGRMAMLKEFSRVSGMPMSEAIRRMIDGALYWQPFDDGSKALVWVEPEQSLDAFFHCHGDDLANPELWQSGLRVVAGPDRGAA